jgi:hypothetical protein
LAQKYTFLDAPGGIEEEMAAEMASVGTACGGDCGPSSFSTAQTPKGTSKGSGECLAKINQRVVAPLLSARLIHLILLFAFLWRLAWPVVQGAAVGR